MNLTFQPIRTKIALVASTIAEGTEILNEFIQENKKDYRYSDSLGAVFKGYSIDVITKEDQRIYKTTIFDQLFILDTIPHDDMEIIRGKRYVVDPTFLPSELVCERSHT